MCVRLNGTSISRAAIDALDMHPMYGRQARFVGIEAQGPGLRHKGRVWYIGTYTPDKYHQWCVSFEHYSDACFSQGKPCTLIGSHSPDAQQRFAYIQILDFADIPA